MVKLPSDHDKKTDPQTQSAASAPGAAPDFNQGVGAYKGSINQQDWSDSKDTGKWSDDPGRRLAIRMFSRGVMGCVFFTAGGQIAKRWMGGGHMDPNSTTSRGYNPHEAWGEQKNPLQVVAKLIDSTVATPIAWAVKQATGSEAKAMSAIHFRPTQYGRSNFYTGKGVQWGRSLGAESVMITFDFFCASIGDAWGRDIAGWFDPNVKHTWIDKQGHISIPKAVDSAINSTLRYVTYNGGEDWAVAIPYAYYMKAQRHLLNKAYPGFGHDFDGGVNGGSFKLSGTLRDGFHNKTHTHQDDHFKIVGNYNIPGIIDLQGRFTVYNIGTLMFREVYDYVGAKLHGKKATLYGSPEEADPNKSVAGKMGDVAKWMMRSTLKGLMVMTPSVPFFWITRTPQTKYRGKFIHPEHGQITQFKEKVWDNYASNPNEPLAPEKRREYLTANVLSEEGLEESRKKGKVARHENGPYFISKYNRNALKGSDPYAPFDRMLIQGRQLEPTAHMPFDAYGKSYGVVDGGLNAIGNWNDKLTTVLDPLAGVADRKLGSFGKGIKEKLGIENFNRFTRPYINAAVSYTPYMYAKAEFSNLFDHGRMDMAAERLIDGATAFKWGEFKKGAGEVWDSIWQRPLADPVREAEALKRETLDTSPPDVFSETKSKREENMQHASSASRTNWRERVVAGQPAEKEPIVPKAKGGDGTSLEDTYKIARKPAAHVSAERKPDSHAEQEEMREALTKLMPPTSSIN